MAGADARFLKILGQNQERLEGATPGFQLQAYAKGRLKLDVAWGKTYPYYDLASLTKVIFTASVLGRFFDQGILRPRDSVRDHWPEFKNPTVTVSELLTHTAGLPWWRPYYKKLGGARVAERRWRQLGRLVAGARREKGRKAVYSDLDLFVLGQVLTHRSGKALAELWADLAEPSLTGNMHFNMGGREFAKSQYAPTERCPWRGRILQGEVHDENAWALGGIAPHAGLFGRIQDVSRWGLEARSCYRGDSSRLMTPGTFRKFTRRHTNPKVGDWGWLFMKPGAAGRTSTGRYFSKSTFGHLGFTGTSLWYDPKQDLLIVILSNRVYPSRKNMEFPRLRPELHDWAVESLK